MGIKRLFFGPEQSFSVSFALLLLRIIAGAAFMMHGWPKIHNPLGWMGHGSSTPAIFQALAAVSEFFGGLGWIIGLLTPLASFGIACTMAVAIWTIGIKGGGPFVAMKAGPSWELAGIYFTIAVLLMTLGPGRFSIDRALGRK